MDSRKRASTKSGDDSEPVKKRRIQSFKGEYTTQWPVLKASKVSTNHVYCSACRSDFSIAIMESDRTDKQWHLISLLKDVNGVLKYKNLAQVMKGILVIPHSNADCGKVFSLVRKNSTDFRPNLGDKTMESILIVKANYRGHRYDQEMSSEDLRRMKGGTYQALKE